MIFRTGEACERGEGRGARVVCNGGFARGGDGLRGVEVGLGARVVDEGRELFEGEGVGLCDLDGREGGLQEIGEQVFGSIGEGRGDRGVKRRIRGGVVERPGV